MSQQGLEFKPYVGLFFQFAERIRKQPEKALVGKKVYGNALKGHVEYSHETLPESVLVVDEKRNYVRFLGPDNLHCWVAKSQIVPLNLPTYDGNPMPLLKAFKSFLIFCSDTKLRDFDTNEMTRRAVDLLPQIEVLIENQKVGIIPKV